MKRMLDNLINMTRVGMFLGYSEVQSITRRMVITYRSHEEANVIVLLQVATVVTI